MKKIKKIKNFLVGCLWEVKSYTLEKVKLFYSSTSYVTDKNCYLYNEYGYSDKFAGHEKKNG
jgi:hypothetical protein